MTFVVKLFWRLFQIIDFILFTLLMYALTWLPKLFIEKYYFSVFRRWTKSFVAALGVDLRLFQQYSSSLPERYILIANHPSAFEDIGIPALFPVRSLAKEEVKKWFIVGRISQASGNLYVKREDKNSRQQALKAIQQALQEGKNIALYPEGGCFGRRIQEQFHFGAFDASLKTGVPIVPVFIHYEEQESFEWTSQSLMQKIIQMMTASNRRVNIYVFEPYSPVDFADRETYSETVRQDYLKWQSRFLD